MEYAQIQYVEPKIIHNAEAKTTGICPICGGELHYEGRCGTCYNCFYNTCAM